MLSGLAGAFFGCKYIIRMLYFIMDNLQLTEITNRLDEIISVLKDSFKPVSRVRRIVDIVAAGVGIMGIIGIIDIIKTWLGG